MRSKLHIIAVAGLVALAACESDTIVIGDGRGGPGAPRDLRVAYSWVLSDFEGSTPVGYPAVDLAWLPPSGWRNEPFRVYGRRSDASAYALIATLTSCTDKGCVYRDRNVVHGTSYDYYVATYDSRTGEETDTEFAEAIRVPALSRPATPTTLDPVALDASVYLRWSAAGSAASTSRYLVYLTGIDGSSYLYRMGETDGTGFLDPRAENGHRYRYRVAAMDTLGHVSALSAEMSAIPRPDFRGELVYAFADSALASGFRFAAAESQSPIVSGSSASAHWRLEADGSGWRIVPLNGARVVEFAGRTTALTCGPGADAGCRAATVAPGSGYQSTPIAVNPEFSYVFQVTGADGKLHYGVVRAQVLGSDQGGRRLMIFDWAYQLVPNEPRLNRLPG